MRPRRVIAILAALFAVGGIAAAAAGLTWAGRMLAPMSTEPRPELFTVEKGASLGRVTQQLESQGLIRSALVAKLAARLEGIEGRLQVGEYELSPHQSTSNILQAITSGRVKTYTATVPEGSRATEAAQRLEEAGLVDAADFLAAVNDSALVRSLGIEGETLEGYLYPDTYRLPRGLSGEAIALVMVRQFEREWAALAPLAEKSQLSKHEIVTMASIVEKETATPEERPLIAAVFLNRLAKKMRLETDPTVIYGIPDFDGNLKRRHLEDRSNPYNTYRISGLPPGPIANPGAEALRAVLTPATSDYLYFVSRNDGTHYFSSTYREHVNAVNRFQKRRRRQ